MRARRFDNILRYHVRSRSRPSEHLVELDTYDCNGACACEHFRFALEPFLKKGVRVSDADDCERADSLRCHHIKQARAQLTDDIIKQAVKSNGGTSPIKRRKPERDNGR